MNDPESHAVGGNALEPPLSSEPPKHAGADHAPSSASKDGSGATGWQPIETAPKDDRTLLLFDGEVRVGWRLNDKWIELSASDFESEGFTTLHPTHWMPLPEPPSD